MRSSSQGPSGPMIGSIRRIFTWRPSEEMESMKSFSRSKASIVYSHRRRLQSTVGFGQRNNEETLMRTITFALLAVLLLASPIKMVRADDKTGGEKTYRVTPEVIYGRKLGMALTFDVYSPKANAN